MLTLHDLENALMSTNAEAKEPTYLTTGCTLLDLVVGGGLGMGLPAGRVVNIVGDKSAGKTFVCAEMLAANSVKCGKRFRHRYDDCESGCTIDSQSIYGMELFAEDDPASTTVEELDANVGRFLSSMKNGQIGMYVVDSLDGLSDNEKEAASDSRRKALDAGKPVMDAGTYGMGAPKFLSQQFFKTKVAKLMETNTLLVVVSQVRENIGAGLYGKKYKRSGGKALDFYAHTVLWLTNVCKIKKGERVVGVVVEACAEKSKTPRPYRKCRFTILFDYGIDNIGSSLDYLYGTRDERGILKPSATKGILWDGTPVTMESMRQWLQSSGFAEECARTKKEESGKATMSLEWAKEWAEKAHPEEFRKHFGTPIPYEDLIHQIENEPAMQKELERRVIEKWEADENSAASHRRQKYA